MIEHISGLYEDREAVRWMKEALRPGGMLGLTFPVDLEFREDYREEPSCGADIGTSNDGRDFFQRHCDIDAIRERLLRPLGNHAFHAAYFGERKPGIFEDYEKHLEYKGLSLVVGDPKGIACHYWYFSSWKEMPGGGAD